MAWFRKGMSNLYQSQSFFSNIIEDIGGWGYIELCCECPYPIEINGFLFSIAIKGISALDNATHLCR
jgi:hypothetical protein